MRKAAKYITYFLFMPAIFAAALLFYIEYNGIEKIRYKCEGEIINRASSHRQNAEASFIFEKYASFMFWTDRIGDIIFEIHGPDAFKIFNVYRVGNYVFWLSEIGERSVSGRWSTINNRLSANIYGDRWFEGYCQLRS